MSPVIAMPFAEFEKENSRQIKLTNLKTLKYFRLGGKIKCLHIKSSQVFICNRKDNWMTKFTYL